MLDHPGTQRILGEHGCSIRSPPCPGFRLSGSGAAQPLAGRWRCSITSGLWGTPASPRSAPCPRALAWAEQEREKHLRYSTSLRLSSIFDTRISSLHVPLYSRALLWAHGGLCLSSAVCTRDSGSPHSASLLQFFPTHEIPVCSRRFLASFNSFSNLFLWLFCHLGCHKASLFFPYANTNFCVLFSLMANALCHITLITRPFISSDIFFDKVNNNLPLLQQALLACSQYT